MGAKQTEFEWLATESAPKGYPMKIIEGKFLYKDSDHGLYIPSGGTLTAGWGTGISNHVVGERFKPLPDRLEIIFFSLAENQFYHGRFDLPYEKILSLFREGVAANKERPLFSSIMVGVAPGGTVAVWLKGSERYVEVLFGKASKIDMKYNGRGLVFNSDEERNAYVRDIFKSAISNEEYQSIVNYGIPFDLWSRYRNKYHWNAVFPRNYIPHDIFISFLNGEHDKTFVLADEMNDSTKHVVPKRIEFDGLVNGKKYYYIVHFDQFEIMEAFEKLGGHDEKVFLEFDPRLPRPTTKVRIYNDKESIELKKTVTEDW